MDKLNVKFDSICHLTGHNRDKRLKRRLLDGVAYASKWLFGIPDAEDAKYYSEAIETLTQQNQNVQILIKKTVHVITADHNKTELKLLKAHTMPC